MKLGVGLVLTAWALLFGLVASAQDPSVAAQGQGQQSAAQRCFEHHRFGAQPVDVAKSADGQTVLAQASWGYHDNIGCYLTLDDAALPALRAAPHPKRLPNAPTDASRRCFKHHKFGENPVDIAKSADRQTVLARLSWGYHDSIGCFLELDNSALAILRAAHTGADTADADLSPAGPQSTPIAAGEDHSCAIRADQTIGCWGGNRFGQIDAPPGRFTAIATGYAHSCAIGTDQVVTCWGYSRSGLVDSPPGQFTAIAASRAHSCAIAADQTVTCWGDTSAGRTSAPAGQFTAIAAGDAHFCAIRADQAIACWGHLRTGLSDIPSGRFIAIAAGRSHSCAIRADQAIACWGDKSAGRSSAPAGQFSAIASGSSHSCAIRADQAITCWGGNNNGQADPPAGQFSAVAAGWAHSCAIRADQAIACWGYDQAGQSSVPASLGTPPGELLSVRVFSESGPAVNAGWSLGVSVEFNRAVSGFSADDINVVNGDVTRFSGSGSDYEATVTAAALGTVVVLIPAAAALDQDGRSNEPSQPFARTVRKMTATATAIASGGFHSCAIRADQAIDCWGYNTYGQTDAPPGRFTAIAAGNSHTCAIRADQAIDCWGYRGSGQTDAPAGQFTAVTAGNSHTCAIRADQAIDCWGYRGSGLADIPAGQFTAVTAGETHSCAIRADQAIICWGHNQHGQTDAPAGRFAAIAAGNSHTCAIRADQAIDCWGGNNDWQGNPAGQADPPAGQFTGIAAGETHSCAIRADQAIICWGDNQHGQTDAPPGRFTAVTAGETHSCAIRADQAIACWGFNRTGQIDVPPSRFTVITPSGYGFGSHVCGIKTDGTIACWTQDGSGRPDASPGQFAAITPDDEFIDTWDREATRAAAWAEFQRQEPDHGWTGDIDRCVAGTTSQPYRDSIFQRINWYRQMAGLNPVVENPRHSATAQHAALIMAAGGVLSHLPSDDRACWTQTGFEGARKSNLYQSRAGTSSIDGYIEDPGLHNIAVGHRSSIFNPNAVEFGTGDIPIRRNGTIANALYVKPESREGSNNTREERGFVAWPPPGYVPPAANWGRWSFNLTDAHRPADFSTASVEVSDQFGPIEIEILSRLSSGIVWGMHGNAVSGLLPPRRPLRSVADSNYCYTVKISGVRINGSVQMPYEYAVCVLTR